MQDEQTGGMRQALNAAALTETDLPAAVPVRHTRHGEEQQKELVRAAFDLIAERGFEGLRTRDVAARAGLNIATLHYYFSTKEDLIRAVVAAAVDQFRTREASDRATVRDPLTELRGFLRGRQQQMEQTPELYTVLLELSTRALRDPAIRSIMRETDEAWRAHLTTQLQTGVDSGAFRSDLNVPDAATALVALSKGLHLMMVVSSDTLVDDTFGAEIERWLTGQPTSPSR